MRRRSDARADAAAELEAAVDAKPNEHLIAERKRLTDPNPEPDPWGLAPTPAKVAEVGEVLQRREAEGMAAARARGASAEGMRQARTVEPETLLQEPGCTTRDEAIAVREARARAREGAAIAIDATARTVTVTIGKQGFAPIRFHTFDVGPFSMTATLPPGASLQAAASSMRAELEAVFRAEFDRTMKEHFALVKAASEGAERAKVRRGDV